ncbi:MAG: class I SAM-dependent methyltransferase [Candidatus Latescibacterota bacterium]
MAKAPWKRTKTICTPYGALAKIYDFVMRHVTYQEWTLFLEDILGSLDFQNPKILDLACGTGTLTLELDARGHDVAGADSAPEMLRVAREKAASSDAAVTFFERDLRTTAGTPTYNVVLCLYDSFNYLCSIEDVRSALVGVANLLTSGGLFIFDICTETNSLKYFRDFTECEHGDGFSYTRHSFYRPKDRMQINEFRIRFDGQSERWTETHRQRIFRVSEIISAIEASPLEMLHMYDEFTFLPGSEDSDRIHFVLRKPTPALS